MRKIQRLKEGLILALTLLLLLPSLPAPVHAGGAPETFTPGQLIEDVSFVAPDTMSVAEIQTFLSLKGSHLAQFLENGRSGAEIIWGAAHGQGSASGNVTGTSRAVSSRINPKVLLVILQKEQSLITSPNPSSAALDWAMGYGCPDGGGCSESYRGFTRQVEAAAWQLQWNYERATLGYSDYQVGQAMTFSNSLSPYNPPATQTVTLLNAATASLYRYTPHVYNGNYNFWNLYRQWFNRWSGRVIARSSNQIIAVGQSAQFETRFLNTGEETWTPATVRLGTDRGQDRIPAFFREDQVGGNPSGWLTANRIGLVEQNVAPGEVGTFRFAYTVPAGLAPGVYREYFRPVADGVEWFSDPDLSWDIRVVSLEESFQAALVNRSANLTLAPGTSGVLEIRLRNTGYLTWQKGQVNLGTDRAQDRIPLFLREDRSGGNPSGWVSPNRVGLLEQTVAPGEVGTFRFAYTVPAGLAPGVYREYFRPALEGRLWLPDPTFDLSFDITVPEPHFSTQWVSQNTYPTLQAGESYVFEVRLNNSGTTVWQKGQVNLGTDRAQDRIPLFLREDRSGGNPSGWVSPNRVGLLEQTVAPGEVGTFRFAYTVPAGLAPGVYREYFRPVADGVEWLQDYGIYWDIEVR